MISAIFEYVKGSLVINHGPEYRVMTNDPTLNEMLVRMQKFKEFGGSEELPGSIDADSRYARLVAYHKVLAGSQELHRGGRRCDVASAHRADPIPRSGA